MVQLTQTGKILVNILLIVLSVLCGSLLFFVPWLKRRKELSLKRFFVENRLRFFASIVLIAGFLTRVAFLDLLPGGLNQDEASAGYDAYAILKYGVDRNGMKYPVHLIAWGSGQNALYSYLCMPFMLLLGVNELSVRLPMAIVGCVSLVLLYRLLKRRYDERIAFLGLAFLAICPWHLMKSRWGLESNLFPDLVFWGFCLLMKGLDDDRKAAFFLSSFVFGLSAYSYGTSYFFLFFFVVAVLVYLFVKKRVRAGGALIYLSIIGCMSLPIIAFVYINLTGGESIRFLCFTIPKLTQDRFQAVTNIFSDTFFLQSLLNIAKGLGIVLLQYDFLPWNAVPFFGTLYLVSLPFTFIGLFKRRKEENLLFGILKIWLIVALAMLLIISPNINRINIVFFPLIVFTIFGIREVIEAKPRLKRKIFALYGACFALFVSVYATVWNTQILENKFYDSYGEAIECAATVEGAQYCYVTPSVGPSYIYVLFYTEYDVRDFIDTCEYEDPGAAFRRVDSFGRYRFYLPEKIERGSVYLVSRSDAIYDGVDLSAYEVTYFKNYYVINAV